MNVDPVHLATIRGLIACGAVEWYRRDHAWPGCDYQQTCDCPPPTYRVTATYFDALERQ